MRSSWFFWMPSLAMKRSAASVASSAVWPRIAEPLCAIDRWNRPFAHGRLSEDRAPTGIAAEALDVVVHPLQRGDEVLHADVRRAGPLRTADSGQVQIAENIESVIDGDDDDVLFLGEVRAVVEQVVAGARRE